jgi:hypothetical protein
VDTEAGEGLDEPVLFLFADETTADAGEMTVNDLYVAADFEIHGLVGDNHLRVELRIAEGAELEHLAVADLTGFARVLMAEDVQGNGAA